MAAQLVQGDADEVGLIAQKFRCGLEARRDGPFCTALLQWYKMRGAF